MRLRLSAKGSGPIYHRVARRLPWAALQQRRECAHKTQARGTSCTARLS